MGSWKLLQAKSCKGNTSGDVIQTLSQMDGGDIQERVS